tara:strand:- start:1041 stop:1469 length:429 start_codon:yes stop_codon:yes gene_type:complete
MTTKRETILAQLKTQLANTTGVGNRIYRSRVTPVDRSEGKVLIIEPISDNCEVQANRLRWTLNVRLSVIARGSASETLDQSADPTVESIHSKISTDVTLGGNAIDMTPRNVSFDLIDGDQPSGVVSCEYIIIYQTSTTDLST